MGAYALAGELVAASGDHISAFAAYDRRMSSLTTIARSGHAGRFLAPPSTWRIRMRNLTFSNRLLFRSTMWMTNRVETESSIPDYRMR